MTTPTLDARALTQMSERPLTLHHVPDLRTVALLHPAGDRPGLLARNGRTRWVPVATSQQHLQLVVCPHGADETFEAHELLIADDLATHPGAREDLQVVLGHNRLPEVLETLADQVAADLTSMTGRPVDVRVPDAMLGEVTLHPATNAAARSRPGGHDRWL